MSNAAENALLLNKHKRRLALREEYLKNISNPHRHATGEGGTVVRYHYLTFKVIPIVMSSVLFSFLYLYL